jgi:hypothetical protein
VAHRGESPFATDCVPDIGRRHLSDARIESALCPVVHGGPTVRSIVARCRITTSDRELIVKTDDAAELACSTGQSLELVLVFVDLR